MKDYPTYRYPFQYVDHFPDLFSHLPFLLLALALLKTTTRSRILGTSRFKVRNWPNLVPVGCAGDSCIGDLSKLAHPRAQVPSFWGQPIAIDTTKYTFSSTYGPKDNDSDNDYEIVSRKLTTFIFAAVPTIPSCSLLADRQTVLMVLSHFSCSLSAMCFRFLNLCFSWSRKTSINAGVVREILRVQMTSMSEK
jgi:hypothetical protein